jgi:transposase
MPDILPLHYLRQTIIEQDFDISKTYTSITPLRAHSENTLRGYLLISFFASSIYNLLSRMLDGSNYNMCEGIKAMNTTVIRVDPSSDILEGFTKQQKEIFNHLKLKYPLNLEKMTFLKKTLL